MLSLIEDPTINEPGQKKKFFVCKIYFEVDSYIPLTLTQQIYQLYILCLS